MQRWGRGGWLVHKGGRGGHGAGKVVWGAGARTKGGDRRLKPASQARGKQKKGVAIGRAGIDFPPQSVIEPGPGVRQHIHVPSADQQMMPVRLPWGDPLARMVPSASGLCTDHRSSS